MKMWTVNSFYPDEVDSSRSNDIGEIYASFEDIKNCHLYKNLNWKKVTQKKFSGTEIYWYEAKNEYLSFEAEENEVIGQVWLWLCTDGRYQHLQSDYTDAKLWFDFRVDKRPELLISDCECCGERTAYLDGEKVISIEKMVVN